MSNPSLTSFWLRNKRKGNPSLVQNQASAESTKIDNSQTSLTESLVNDFSTQVIEKLKNLQKRPLESLETTPELPDQRASSPTLSFNGVTFENQEANSNAVALPKSEK